MWQQYIQDNSCLMRIQPCLGIVTNIQRAFVAAIGWSWSRTLPIFLWLVDVSKVYDPVGLGNASNGSDHNFDWNINSA